MTSVPTIRDAAFYLAIAGALLIGADALGADQAFAEIVKILVILTPLLAGLYAVGRKVQAISGELNGGLTERMRTIVREEIDQRVPCLIRAELEAFTRPSQPSDTGRVNHHPSRTAKGEAVRDGD